MLKRLILSILCLSIFLTLVFLLHFVAGGAGSGSGGSGSASGTSRAPQRPRGRVVRAVARGRGTGVIVGTRPLVPASVVPEELINQCQVVLQGKSRTLIIRELQRTVSCIQKSTWSFELLS